MHFKFFLFFIVIVLFTASVKAQLPLSNDGMGCTASSTASPDAAPCNGASVTPIVFRLASRTLVSNAGTSDTNTAVYRYVNAGVAPDGTALDAIVSIVDYTNNQDGTPTNFPSADIETVGFADNLQPSIGGTNTNQVNSPWNGSIRYRIQFVVSGTSTPKRITVAAISLDNDGSTACGGLRESITYSTALNQVLTTATTAQILSGNTVTAGSGTVQSGIGDGPDFASAALYINVEQFEWTYGFSTSGNCAANGAGEVRYGSLNLTCQITNFGRSFAAASLSGRIFNDVNGTTGGIADQNGTNAGNALYVNLVDASGYVVSTAVVQSDGTYSFPAVNAASYTVQLSNSPGVESNLAPARTLPTDWVNTGENFGAGTGTDGNTNGALAVTVGASSITNVNFGIEQRPTPSGGTAASQNNPGGTTTVTVPATVFTAADPSGGTISSIRLAAFPSNATSFSVGTITYYPSAGAIPGVCPTAACQTFPGSLSLTTNSAGNPVSPIRVDPLDNAVTVGFRFYAADNAGFESANFSTANVPFLVPTAADGEIAGKLYFEGSPLGKVLIVLTDTATGVKKVVRTDAGGAYSFENNPVGRTYIVQPLNNRYAFNPATRVISLTGGVDDIDFTSLRKAYRPANDFDGDGRSDLAVYRPSNGTWYVLRSSDGQMSAFAFGLPTDLPTAGDYDGDGRTDYAVFRPSNGFWYIWQSASESLRAAQFGMSGDQPIPADYEGDGKTDLAVYREGMWYIRHSSDQTVATQRYGTASDVPFTGDFDGDGKADTTVFRPSDGFWHSMTTLGGQSNAGQFGLATDTPVPSDYDGDGRTDVAQFRNGAWYFLNSTIGFETHILGADGDRALSGDYDGDGRSDPAVYRNGLWMIRRSSDNSVSRIYFGSPDDVLVK